MEFIDLRRQYEAYREELEEAVLRVDPDQLDQLLHPSLHYYMKQYYGLIPIHHLP
jgi:hypothetical protein